MRGRKIETLTIKSVISVILASVFIVQIFSITQVTSTTTTSNNNNNYDSILQSSLAQSDSTTTIQAGGQNSSSSVLIKEIEKMLMSLGNNISPSDISTSNSLPLEFGIRPGGIKQPVVLRDNSNDTTTSNTTID